jgi:predicted transcriptional regulator
MYFPCEAVVHNILPVFRSLVARELVEKYNFTQVEAAAKLGTTQASVSLYIHSKRGCKGIGQFEKILPLIQCTSRDIAKGIATQRMSSEQIMSRFRELCMIMRKHL